MSQHNKTHIVYLEKLTEKSQHLRHIPVKLFVFKNEEEKSFGHIGEKIETLKKEGKSYWY